MYLADKKNGNCPLRQRKQRIASDNSGYVLESLSGEQTLDLLRECRIHQAELEKQNEELRQTQHELRVSKLRYFDLYDRAPVGYLTLNEQKIILEANLTAAAMLGTGLGGLLNKKISDFIIPDDQAIFYLSCRRLMKTDEPQGCEMRMLGANGEPFWVKIDAIVAHGTGPASYRVVMSDISELKRIEDDLQKSRDKLEERVEERTADLALANMEMRRVSFELVWAEEKERERIAAELHDRVGQSLLLAKLKLDGLAELTGAATQRKITEEVSCLVENSIRDIRSLTFKMRPPILDTSGIETALEWLCSSISDDYDIRVDYSGDKLPVSLSAEVRYSLYQAARELLLNVVKHAGTDSALLSLKIGKGALTVVVADHGKGFKDPAVAQKHIVNGGYGLYNVQQRIEKLGGLFEIESESGKGTSVIMTVPLGVASDQEGA